MMCLMSLNRGNAPTIMTIECQEVLDSTKYSISISESFRDRHVSPETCLSDRRHVCFSLRADKSDPVKYRNPKVSDWNTYREDLGEYLSIIVNRIRSIDQLEFALNIEQRAIHKS